MCNIVLHVHRIFIYECQSYRPGFHDTETTEQDTISQWGGGGGTRIPISQNKDTQKVNSARKA